MVGVVEPLPAAGWNRDPLGGAGVAARFFASPRLPSVTAYGPFLLPLDDLVRSGSTLDRLDVTGHPDLARPARTALDAVDASFGSADARLTAAVGGRAGTERDLSALPATLATVRTQESVTGASVLVVVLLTDGPRRSRRSRSPAGSSSRCARTRPSCSPRSARAGGSSPPSRRSRRGIVAARRRRPLAVPLAGLAHAALTRLPAVRRAGLAGTAAATPASVLVIALGAAALAAVLVVPAVFDLPGDRADRRDRRGLLLRSGVDLLAVALAGIGLWQLRAQPPVSAGPDVVRTVAPVLCLLAGSLLVLRAVPPLLAAATRGPARRPPSCCRSPPIEATRRPRAAAGALLVTLGATSGVLRLGPAHDLGRRPARPGRPPRRHRPLGDADVAAAPRRRRPCSRTRPAARCRPPLRRNVLVGGWLGEPGAPPQLVAVDTRRAGQLLRGRAPEGPHLVGCRARPRAGGPRRAASPSPRHSPATLAGTASDGDRRHRGAEPRRADAVRPAGRLSRPRRSLSTATRTGWFWPQPLPGGGRTGRRRPAALRDRERPARGRRQLDRRHRRPPPPGSGGHERRGGRRGPPASSPNGSCRRPPGSTRWTAGATST